eukprot:2206540-Amphidinium_carterae.1
MWRRQRTRNQKDEYTHTNIIKLTPLPFRFKASALSLFAAFFAQEGIVTATANSPGANCGRGEEEYFLLRQTGARQTLAPKV